MLSFLAFVAALYTYLQIYFPQLINPDSQIPDVPENKTRKTYDIIIVGGGTSGCVLAGRLTENTRLSVLLIEAGGDGNALSATQLIFRAVYDTEREWNYTTTPQKKVCQSSPENICTFPRGRLLGGSGVFSTWYSRGNKRDYDMWAAMGNTNWNSKTMLYYFKKMENIQIPSLANSPYHGRYGPWPVQYPRYVTKLRDEYLKAGQEFGWDVIDYNGEYQYGIGKTQYSMFGSIGASTSITYLNPARNRKNLDVIKWSRVSKILLNEHNNRAVGVEYVRNGKTFTAKAHLEVILAAGAISSPQLLMLSGIGPDEEQKRIGIEPRKVLPVGKNLLDQVEVDLVIQINKPLTITTNVWRTNESAMAYAKHRNGPLSTTGWEVDAYFNSIKSGDTPNVGICFYSWDPLAPLNETQNTPLITMRVLLLFVKSSGTVTLKSSNIYDDPLINPNYLSVESDYIGMEQAVYWALEYLKTPTMKKYSPKLDTSAYEECTGKEGKQLVRCLVGYAGAGLVHPVGTTKMGPSSDPNAVVTQEQLKVRGFENLRVIDESVIPYAIRGNTATAVVAIAEKAADIIKNDYKNLYGNSNGNLYG